MRGEGAKGAQEGSFSPRRAGLLFPPLSRPTGHAQEHLWRGLNTHSTRSLSSFSAHQKASLIGIIDIPPSLTSAAPLSLFSSVHFSRVRWKREEEEERGNSARGVHSLMMAMGFLPQCSIKARPAAAGFSTLPPLPMRMEGTDVNDQFHAVPTLLDRAQLCQC